MNNFEKLCQEAGIDDNDKPWVKDFYVAGLRRAAEIANSVGGRQATHFIREAIEQEATRIESEGE